jgi:hypothetical protein
VYEKVPRRYPSHNALPIAQISGAPNVTSRPGRLSTVRYLDYLLPASYILENLRLDSPHRGRKLCYTQHHLLFHLPVLKCQMRVFKSLLEGLFCNKTTSRGAENEGLVRAQGISDSLKRLVSSLGNILHLESIEHCNGLSVNCWRQYVSSFLK